MAEVIDSSVAIKWFVEEEGRQAALDVLSRVIANPEEFYVPELFYFELAHVLNKMIDQQAPQRALYEHVLEFGINRMPMSSELFFVVSHFQTLGLSGYDASYVALAKAISGTWLTFDAKAHKKIEHLQLSRCLVGS